MFPSIVSEIDGKWWGKQVKTRMIFLYISRGKNEQSLGDFLPLEKKSDTSSRWKWSSGTACSSFLLAHRLHLLSPHFKQMVPKKNKWKPFKKVHIHFLTKYSENKRRKIYSLRRGTEGCCWWQLGYPPPTSNQRQVVYLRIRWTASGVGGRNLVFIGSF